MTAVPLRALTVRQPYADAIVQPGPDPKRIENRTWPAPPRHIGTRFLLHAAAATAVRPVLPDGADTTTWPGVRGAILAVVTLAGCHFDGPDCLPACTRWGHTEVFHWHLADVLPLARPVPATGALGFWTPAPDVQDAVRAQTDTLTLTAQP